MAAMRLRGAVADAGGTAEGADAAAANADVARDRHASSVRISQTRAARNLHTSNARELRWAASRLPALHACEEGSGAAPAREPCLSARGRRPGASAASVSVCDYPGRYVSSGFCCVVLSARARLLGSAVVGPSASRRLTPSACVQGAESSQAAGERAAADEAHMGGLASGERADAPASERGDAAVSSHGARLRPPHLQPAAHQEALGSTQLSPLPRVRSPDATAS